MEHAICYRFSCIQLLFCSPWVTYGKTALHRNLLHRKISDRDFGFLSRIYQAVGWITAAAAAAAAAAAVEPASNLNAVDAAAAENVLDEWPSAPYLSPVSAAVGACRKILNRDFAVGPFHVHSTDDEPEYSVVMGTFGTGFGTERRGDRRPIWATGNVDSKMDRLEVLLLDGRLPVQPHLQRDVWEKNCKRKSCERRPNCCHNRTLHVLHKF